MKRLLSLLLCLSAILPAAGCALDAHPAGPLPEEEAAGPVELEWYVNYSWYNTPWGGNAVSEAITAATGVDITIVSPGGSETETLDALIAGNNLPDLVTLGWWEPQLSTIITQGLVYPLNQLADEYDMYFWEVADEARLNWYTASDGSVYCYPNSSYAPADYGGDVPISSNQTFLVRRDIYEAIGSPDMTTTEGFADAVRAAAEKFPTVDGLPLIPIGAHEFTERGCDSFDQFLMNFLAIPRGKDGKFYDRYTDPEYKRWLAMFRQLGEEGLPANDIFIDKRVQMEEKIAQGRYFCMLYQHTDIADAQRLRCSRDPDSVYIAVDGPKNTAGDHHQLPGSGLNGWTVTMISKNCRHPDKAIHLMSFLMSEEGQKLISLGIEGEHYTMENGRAVLSEETERLLNEDYAAYLAQVGGNDAYWMLQDTRMQSRWMPLDEPVLRQPKEWTYPYTVYTGQYDVSFTPGSEADAADKKITAIHGEMLPRLLLAATQEEFEWQWELYVYLREINGLDLVLEESTRQMNTAKARLGLD